LALTLSSLYEHPLKSARGNAVDAAVVRPEGLAFDRRFLAHTPDGTFVSGRSHPRLVLVDARWDGTALTLVAPGESDLTVVPDDGRGVSVAVWKDRFDAWDLGDGPARWLSRFLGDEVRLAWLGESRRVLRWDLDRRVTFADAAPLLAIGTASLADLSARVGEPLSMRRFRPNLVIDGAQAFEEDSWRRLRIGEVELLHLDGCGRCEFTTIDPETGARHPRGEPVATLESYRRVDTGIYFGMNLMPLTSGLLRVGDPVTVLERRTPLVFGPFPLVPAPRPEWPGEATLLRCTAVHPEAQDVVTFSLERRDGRPGGWQPGQYLTLKIDLPGETLRRSYTISSARDLQITVKRVGDGRGSTWLHDHLTPGGEVVAEGLGGRFTLGDNPWPSYLLLGAGTGMTPLVALVEQIADENLPVAVVLHQSARTWGDVLFAGRLENLKARLVDRLTVITRITSAEGRLDHQSLVTLCPDLRDRVALVCGPSGYRASVRGLLAGAGFKVEKRYREEVFGEDSLEVPEDAVPGTVTFVRSGKVTASDGRTTVLQLAERLAVSIPSSCRSGDCGTCRVQTASGEWVLACRTFPRGDLTVNL